MALLQPEILKGIPLFTALPGADLQYLADAFRERRHEPGTVLFYEGERGDAFYVVQEGQVAVIKSLGTPDERSFGVRGPGEFFGEMSLLDPAGLRTASIRAESPVCLLEMSRSDFDEMLRTRPALAYEILRVLSLRLRDANDATISDLRAKNSELARAYEELKAAQAQIIEKEKLEQELETARWIQQSILPRGVPREPGFDFGARMEPARAVGGDLYDFIRLDDEHLGVVIGDVSDKGVPAAIFMALTRSLLRAESTLRAKPRRVLQRVNNLLLEMNSANLFVTVLYGILDCREATFTYARAGHELPLLLDRERGAWSPEPRRGQMLGLFDSPAVDERQVALPPGTMLLLHTDGATDMMNPSRARFGAERLANAALAAWHAGGTAQGLCDAVMERLRAFQAHAEQADDVALVAIRANDLSR
jgi:phosphoserine phosphatase RsbU/P